MNLRTIFISSFLSLSSLGVLAQERINLSGTWQFAFAANQKEADRLERFYTSDFAKEEFYKLKYCSTVVYMVSRA